VYSKSLLLDLLQYVEVLDQKLQVLDGHILCSILEILLGVGAWFALEVDGFGKCCHHFCAEKIFLEIYDQGWALNQQYLQEHFQYDGQRL
jgi:hypothetical protein